MNPFLATPEDFLLLRLPCRLVSEDKASAISLQGKVTRVLSDGVTI